MAQLLQTQVPSEEPGSAPSLHMNGSQLPNAQLCTQAHTHIK